MLNLLFHRSILAVLGSVLQRATPIILGAIVLRIAGDQALFVHNTWFIAASLCAAFTAGGVSPHILRKFSSFKGIRDRSTLPSLAFLILFAAFTLGYTILRGNFPSLLFLLAAFAFSRMMVSIAILQARAKLLRVVILQMIFLAVTLIISVCLLLLQSSASWIFYVAYGAAATPAVLSTLKIMPILPRMISNIDRDNLKEIINYSLYGIFGVAIGFIVLLYLQEHMQTVDYNHLVFTYQLYSLIIFIPGILSVVTVPFLSKSGLVNEKRKNFILPLVYFAYALPISIIGSLGIDVLANLYGFEDFISTSSLHFILYSAVPTSIVAGLNQMNIVAQRSQIPLFSVAMGNITLVFLMIVYVSSESYGYALFASVCINATCSFLLTLYKKV